MRAKRSLYNFLFSLLSTVVTFAIGIVIPRLFLVNLGSEANGLVSSVGQIFAYVSLMEAGIGATTKQALYKPIADKDQLGINRILSASNQYYKKIGFIYIGCVAAIALVYPLLVKSALPTWQVICVVGFSGMANAINFLLQQNYIVLLSAEGRGYVTTNLNLLVNVLSSLVKAILLTLGYNVAVVVGAQFCFTLVRITLLRLYINRKYQWIDIKQEPDRSALSKQRYVMAQQISYFVYSNTDILVLTVFCNLKVVSVYTIYTTIVGVIEGVVGSIVTSIAFALGQLYNEDFGRFKKLYSAYDSSYMLLLFMLYTVVGMLIVPFLSIYTRGITDINYLDYKLAFLFVALKMVTTLRSQSQNAVDFAGHFKETQHMAIIEAISNIVISLICVSFMGIYGVVIGSIVSTFYRGIAVTNYVNKNILKNNRKESMMKYIRWIVYLAIFLAFFFISQRIIPMTMDNYFTWIKAGVVCTLLSLVVYGGLWVAMDKENVIYILNLVKEKLHRGKND